MINYGCDPKLGRAVSQQGFLIWQFWPTGNSLIEFYSDWHLEMEIAEVCEKTLHSVAISIDHMTTCAYILFYMPSSKFVSFT